MKRPAQYEAGIALISELLDEKISEADFDRLQEMLQADPDLRQVYLQAVDQEVELSYRPPQAGNFVVFPNRIFKPILLTAAAILVMALLAFALLPPADPGKNEIREPVAGTDPKPPHPPPYPPNPGPPPDPPDMVSQRPVPSAPDTWLVDFESGLPSGWTGEFASSELPAGSQGAVRTMTKYSPEENTTYRQILPPMAWGVGHFAIRADTHLHLTLKVEKSAWFDIFLMTHVSDPDRSDTAIYRLADSRLWMDEGRWKKVSIPLSQFQGKDEVTREWLDDSPPKPGEIAWQVFFSSANSDLQLVIDEIRIDREGPGKMAVENVE